MRLEPVSKDDPLSGAARARTSLLVASLVCLGAAGCGRFDRNDAAGTDHRPATTLGSAKADVPDPVVEAAAPAPKTTSATTSQRSTADWKRETQPHRPSAAVDDGDGTQARAKAAALEYFTDTRLFDQHGRGHRFYSDLIAGRTVLISSFLTRCEGSCSIVNQTLRGVQAHLEKRGEKQVRILSISVDAGRDKQPDLAAYARKFGAGPQWLFLSGPSQDVELVLRKLGQFAEDPQAHSNVILIGNSVTGLWKKAFGLGSSRDLLPVLDSVIDDPGSDRG